jgi:tetratricopeptide (TPR) repeat protein
VRFGWSKSPGESLKRAVELGTKALSLDETISDVHALLGAIYMVQRQYEEAIAAGQRSVSLGPNSAISHVLFARTLIYVGRFEEAIALVQKGIRLSPYCPAFYFYHLGHAYTMAKRYKEAAETFNELLARSKEDEFNPTVTHLCLAESYVGLGFEEKARGHAAEVLRLNPGFSLDV